MLWLEVIRVRSTHDLGSVVQSGLAKLLEPARNTLSPVDVRVYEHSRIPGDLAVHLLWQAGSCPSGPTMLGTLIADYLRTFGMVDDSLWKQVRL